MTQQRQPLPFSTDSLSRLRSANVPISVIVDVGVREKTLQLVEAFPDKHHHLFEPVKAFFPDIARNYATIAHTLHKMALSDDDGEAYLVERSLQSNGKVTHSEIRSKPEAIDGKRTVACEVFPVRRFDSLKLDVPSNFLLKVDVDGLDLKVLRGFGKRLQQASAVMMEVTTRTLFDRLELLVRAGFQPFDVVDLIYYGNSLYQADLVMVRGDLITADVFPPSHPHRGDLWKAFHAGHINAEAWKGR